MSITTLIVLISVYVLGYIISYLMLLTEHKAEGNVMTFGDRSLLIVLSFLSWLVVIRNLVFAWIKVISLTGYWLRPVKEEKKEEISIINDKRSVNVSNKVVTSN